ALPVRASAREAVFDDPLHIRFGRHWPGIREAQRGQAVLAFRLGGGGHDPVYRGAGEGYIFFYPARQVVVCSRAACGCEFDHDALQRGAVMRQIVATEYREWRYP